MFTAIYPAAFLPEVNGKGLHVRFPELPEALTGGDDLADTFAEATDCLAEAIAGRIARGDEISPRRRSPATPDQRSSLPCAEAGVVSRHAGTRDDSGRAGGTRQAHHCNVRGCRVRSAYNPFILFNYSG
jgi:predicted RNase H-like HicB family nuclease